MAAAPSISAGVTPAAETVAPLTERELVALWLLGRAPAAVLPDGWTLLRPGRAGRGPGPDIREAAFRLRSGALCAGDVEVHLRASDFFAHGHADNPAYAGVRLHLVWVDDRAAHGTPLALPGGGYAPTAEVAPTLRHDPERLRRLVARGASGREPCAGLGARRGVEPVREALRHEGRRRLAERVWLAAELAQAHGWDGAWERLLTRALEASAGRRRFRRDGRAQLSTAALTADLRTAQGGLTILQALRALALAGRPALLIEALRGRDAGHAETNDRDEGSSPRVGAARAAELGWNAALPLLMAAATAYDDAPLARATAQLAASWPAPRPYGRTSALRAQLLEAGSTAGGVRLGGGALAAQGLLHLQDLWCERGGCGVCPLSRAE